MDTGRRLERECRLEGTESFVVGCMMLFSFSASMGILAWGIRGGGCMSIEYGRLDTNSG